MNWVESKLDAVMKRIELKDNAGVVTQNMAQRDKSLKVCNNN